MSRRPAIEVYQDQSRATKALLSELLAAVEKHDERVAGAVGNGAVVYAAECDLHNLARELRVALEQFGLDAADSLGPIDEARP